MCFKILKLPCGVEGIVSQSLLCVVCNTHPLSGLLYSKCFQNTVLSNDESLIVFSKELEPVIMRMSHHLEEGGKPVFIL